jgi:hypothetical protein
MAAVPSADSGDRARGLASASYRVVSAARPPKSNRVCARVASRAPLTGMSVFYH